MKVNFIYVVALGVFSVLFSGCAINLGGSSPVGIPMGSLYTQVTIPAHDLEVAADGTAKASKVGKSTCTNILGLIASGDCGTDAAMRSANISRVQSVDFEYLSILGIITKRTTVVRGE